MPLAEIANLTERPILNPLDSALQVGTAADVLPNKALATYLSNIARLDGYLASDRSVPAVRFRGRARV
jgi:hypothetical protein